MTIRVAAVSDLVRVIELRMRLFAEYHETLSPADIVATEQANRSFFEEHLNSPLARTWVAEAEGQVVAVGTLAIFVRPPHPGNLAGKEAYLLNMYTLPEYRRRGFAHEILNAAMAYASSQGIKRVWLHASEVGRPLYEDVGFRTSSAYMELKLP